MSADGVGRVAVITGTGGLGLEAACKLAERGFKIILGGRNHAAGEAAVARILSNNPGAVASFVPLDLADLRSVSDFAAQLYAMASRLDVLLNNAGVMSPPKRLVTRDGFELQFGVNYLGHFALTGQLLPLLRRNAGSRVVNVTSIAHKYGDIDLDDLQNERRYHPGISYCQSKLAQAMFTREFQRRSQEHGWGIDAIAAHPGFARTNLFAGKDRGKEFVGPFIGSVVGHILGHSAQSGAQSLVHAATDLGALGGALYGPSGLFEMRGKPTLRKFAPNACNAEKSARLWDISRSLSSVHFAT